MDPTKNSPVSTRESPESLANSAKNTSPPFSNNGTDQKLDTSSSGDSNCSYPVASGSIEKADSTSNRSLPDEQEDEAYWERRRKNNEAVIISRDYRRMQEDLAKQACMLREQNIQLANRMTGLKENMQHMQSQRMSISDKYRTLDLQLRSEKEQLRLEKD